VDQEDPSVPVITLESERFSRFVGHQLTLAEMEKWLPWLGFDIEEVGENHVKVEFNPNRVDFCSYAGVARAFKGLRGWEIGLPKYEVKSGTTVLNVKSTVSTIRPFMLGAVVRNIKLDEPGVADLMDMQEDLHWGIGRDRKKASIGVHNLDVVTPPFTFTTAKPKSTRFTPLDTAEDMSLHEILEKHEKGKKYRQLVDWARKYPLLVDKDGNVLSMPPIINGELTRIDEKTRNLFLDVTGTDYRAVERSLNVLSTALADMGGTIEMVEVRSPNHTVVTPNLTPEETTLRTTYAEGLLGLQLSGPQVVACLQKCRLGAKEHGRRAVKVEVPAYRIDILHEVDLVEEVAIGYGYYNIRPTFPSSVTIGGRHPTYETANGAKQVMIGLGFTEVVNFTLTNERTHYEMMRRPADHPVTLANPISNEYTIMRQDLLPNLMTNLAANRHESFPQKLFEASDVVRRNSRLETQCERRMHLAAVTSHPAASFTETRSALEALLTNMNMETWSIRAKAHPSFIAGRAAAIYVQNTQVGVLGEMHPEVLNNFNLENPVAAFESDLEFFSH
jgi:phenylalanyl-tRNA synthetase beta chain